MSRDEKLILGIAAIALAVYIHRQQKQVEKSQIPGKQPAAPGTQKSTAQEGKL